MPKEGPEGPLAPFLRSFAKSLSQQGYTRKLSAPAGDARRVFQSMAQAPSSTLAPYHVRALVTVFKMSTSPATGHSGDPAALKHLMAFLRAHRVMPAREDFSTTSYVGRSAAHDPMIGTCGATALWPRRRSLTMSPSFGIFSPIDSVREQVKLSHLSAAEVVRFVQSRAPRSACEASQADDHCTALLSFSTPDCAEQ